MHESEVKIGPNACLYESQPSTPMPDKLPSAEGFPVLEFVKLPKWFRDKYLEVTATLEASRIDEAAIRADEAKKQ